MQRDVRSSVFIFNSRLKSERPTSSICNEECVIELYYLYPPSHSLWVIKKTMGVNNHWLNLDLDLMWNQWHRTAPAYRSRLVLLLRSWPCCSHVMEENERTCWSASRFCQSCWPHQCGWSSSSCIVKPNALGRADYVPGPWQHWPRPHQRRVLPWAGSLLLPFLPPRKKTSAIILQVGHHRELSMAALMNTHPPPPASSVLEER